MPSALHTVARRAGALLLGHLLLLGTAAAQEWYEYYEQGREAVAEQRWDDAIRNLSRAIALRDEPGANVKTYGLQFIDYFPYTYRGMAEYKAGHYDDALKDLERADRIGAAREGRSDNQAGAILREYLGLTRQYAVDSKTYAAAVSAHRQKDYRAALDGFKAIGTTSPYYAEAQRYITMTEEELRARRAREPVAEERAVDTTSTPPVATAAKPPAPPPEDQDFTEGVKFFATKEYARAEAKFRAVLSRDRSHREAADYLRRIRDARAREQQLAARPEPTPTRPAPAAQPPATDRRDAAEDSLVSVAVALFESGLLERAEQTFTAVRKANPSQSEAAFYLEKISANRRSIREGVVAYLEGEYEAAISQLSDAARVNKENAVLYGYLAASCAARYYLTGAEDEDLRSRAQTAFRTARQLDATYSPDRRYTSPRIISMLNSPQESP